MKTRPSSIGLLLALFGTTTSFTANAGNAESLFAEGKKLLAQGNAIEACRKFEESHQLEVTIGARFQVAQCHERAGRTASAWAGYLEVAAMAKSRGQASREKAARDKAADLAPRLVRLIVDVAGSSTAGLTIKRNDVAIQRADWNTSLPVDPGSYTVVASAPERQPWTTTIEVTSQKSSWDVHVPDLEPITQVHAPSAEIAPAHVLNDNGKTVAAEPPGHLTRLRTIALVTAGSSVLALGAGAFFTVSAVSKSADSDPHCRGTTCDPTGVSMRSDAVSAGNLATVMVVTGGVLLATSVVLWVLNPPARSETRERETKTAPQPPGARVEASLGIGGVGLRGTF